MRALKNYLKSGEGIVIFPEGTYYRDEVGPGQIGMIRLLCSRFEGPLIPVGMTYKKGRRRLSVRIHFGRQILAEDSKDVGALRDRIMNAIASLSEL